MLQRVLILFLSLTVTIANAGLIQKTGLTLPSSASSNAQLVVSTFQSAYNDYKTYAWKHDDLKPKSKGASDPRNGWGATIFDAMTTMKIMGLDVRFSVFIEKKRHGTKDVSFYRICSVKRSLMWEALTFRRVTPVTTSRSYYALVMSARSRLNIVHNRFFETTIRYLASMLSAYELNGQKDDGLIQQAKKLGDKLVYAYPTNGNPIPYGSVDFANNAADAGDGTGPNNIAAAASNSLEFYKLSQYTGNNTYQKLAENAFRIIASNVSNNLLPKAGCS